MWERIKAGWHELAEAARAKWEDLTDDELEGLKRIGADLEARFEALKARAGSEAAELGDELAAATAEAKAKLAELRAAAELKAHDLGVDLEGASEEVKARVAEIRAQAESWAETMVARLRRGDDRPEA